MRPLAEDLKLGLALPYDGALPFAESLELALRAEGLGFDSVWVPEAWGFDAISMLGALAVRTERIRLGTGIVNVFSRAPALLAQTAVTLDAISSGRFILGLGTSGHQVISGWHGIPFERPVLRLRETVEIVRRVLRREPLRFSGEIFQLTQGLKLLAHPRRAEVPIFLATLTPAGIRLTAEVADGWLPILFSPAHMHVFRPELEEGASASGRKLDDLEIAPFLPVAPSEDRGSALDALRPWVALYVGGMGSRARNYYNQTVQRYGFVEEAAEIQDLYLSGKKIDAVRRVPDALVDAVTLSGPPGAIRERVQACAAAGVTTIVAGVGGPDQQVRLRALEILADAAA